MGRFVSFSVFNFTNLYVYRRKKKGVSMQKKRSQDTWNMIESHRESYLKENEKLLQRTGKKKFKTKPGKLLYTR